MKNYRESDYAINKHAAGIVYRFANETLEITLEQYLHDNPDKMKEDFLTLKRLSDAIYYEQDRDVNAQTKKDISIHGLEDIIASNSISLENRLIETQEKQNACAMISFARESTIFTEIQRRRFLLHVVEGLSHREIAALEGVTYHAVALSLRYALKKLKKYF